MRIDTSNTDLLGFADQALLKITASVNFALKTLVSRAADHLDVGQGRIRLEFGRNKGGVWDWQARLRDEHGKTLHLGRGPGPMEAIAELVEKAGEDAEQPRSGA